MTNEELKFKPGAIIYISDVKDTYKIEQEIMNAIRNSEKFTIEEANKILNKIIHK